MPGKVRLHYEDGEIQQFDSYGYDINYSDRSIDIQVCRAPEPEKVNLWQKLMMKISSLLRK